jgi:hypothetical protein
MQDGMGEIHLIPAQVREFGRSETVAEGDKDHGGIPVTPAIGFSDSGAVSAGGSRHSDRIRCG